MRNHLKMLQNYDYMNMYIIYCDNIQNITFCDPRKGIIRYRVALFLFVLFRNISQYISKYFKIYFEIFWYAISFKRFHIFILLMKMVSDLQNLDEISKYLSLPLVLDNKNLLD